MFTRNASTWYFKNYQKAPVEMGQRVEIYQIVTKWLCWCSKIQKSPILKFFYIINVQNKLINYYYGKEFHLLQNIQNSRLFLYCPHLHQCTKNMNLPSNKSVILFFRIHKPIHKRFINRLLSTC